MSQSLPQPGAMGVKLRVLLLLVSSAFSSAVAQAACSTPTHIRDLNTAMDEAEQAYMDLDLDGFMAASKTLEEAIPCLSDALTPATAARVHATFGLRGFLDNDRRESTQAFAAARFADASYRLSSSLVPRDAPEWDFYDSVDLSMGGMEKVPAANGGFLSFDGKEGLERPSNWPTLVQVFTDAADVLETAYLRPGDAMPAYRRAGGGGEVAAGGGTPTPDLFREDDDDPFGDVLADDDPIPPPPPRSTGGSSSASGARATPDDPPERAGTPTRSSGGGSSSSATRDPTPTSRPTGTSRSIPEHSVLDTPPRRSGEGGKGTHGGLIAAVSVSAVATGVAYGLGLNAASQYRDEATPLENLDGLRTQANIFSGIAGGAGLVLLGTGIALGVTW